MKYYECHSIQRKELNASIFSETKNFYEFKVFTNVLNALQIYCSWRVMQRNGICNVYNVNHLQWV